MKNSAILAIAMLTASVASAQTLQVNTGNVTYSFPAEQTGVMSFTGGTSLDVMGKTFTIADLSTITVDNVTVADNTVEITYGGTSASVRIAGNIARYITAGVSGAHVVITQSEEVGDDTCGEITYSLTGTSSDGSFTLNADYKASLELSGLNLTSSSGAAINIQSGKRTAIRVKEGTENSLSDATGGSQKAALYCKGHLEFKQKGKLSVTGNCAHAIAAKEYIEVKNTSITIPSAKKDGINCNQYFMIESGSVKITDSGDDGIQVAFKDATNREEEDTGNFILKGGTLDITNSSAAAKAIKAEGDFIATKGEITATVKGIGIWDSTNKKTKAAACIGVDGNVDISGGSFTLTATGGGGKGISVDGSLLISDGTFAITTTGGHLAYVNGTLNQNYTGNADNLNSDYKSSPKGIKVDGTITIDGGAITIDTKGAGGEGIESKKTLTINGGDITVRAYEDGTNSSSHTFINGGNITVTTGTGDAIDANGNITVSGGNITIVGAASPEQGFDAGDGYGLYLTGGTILAAGGGNSAPSSTASTQAYVILSQTVSAGQTVSISDGDTTLATFTIPEKYGTSASSPMRAPGGWNWGWGGGSSGGSLLISAPTMVNGKSYTVTIGSTSVTATARLTGGSSGPGH